MKRDLLDRRALLGALLAAPALPLRAQEPALRVLLPDMEPYAYLNAAGEAQGVYVTLARQIAARAGVAVQVDIAPVARVVHEVNGGAADFTLLLPYNFSPDVRQLGPVLPMEVWLLPRAGLPLAHAGEVQGRVVVGFKGTPAQLSLPPGVSVHWQDANSARVMVSMVKVGRADAALGVRETLMSGLRAAGLRGSAEEGFGKPLALGQIHVSLWGRAGMAPATADALVRGLHSLKQDGELTRIRHQHFEEGGLPLKPAGAR